MLGSTINTDAADVAVLLSEYGIDVYWQTVVGDNPGRVIEAVRRAKDRADLIITTGGLGPTCDDLTKAALAEAFGMQLELNTEEEAWLRGVFKKRGYPELTPNNLQQVWLPEGSTARTPPAATLSAAACASSCCPGLRGRSGPCSSTACGPSSRSSPTLSSPRTTSTSTA